MKVTKAVTLSAHARPARSSEHSCQRQSRSQVWRTNNATDNIWIALLAIETPKALNEAVVYTYVTPSKRPHETTKRPSVDRLVYVLYFRLKTSFS